MFTTNRSLTAFGMLLLWFCAQSFGSAWAATAQIAYLGGDSAESIEQRRLKVVKSLEALGHRSGVDFLMTGETFNGETAQLQLIAKRIVASRPTIIFAGSWDVANEVKKHTSTIPVVFAARANLESSTFRIVENLQQPERNLTGFTRYVNLIPKKLQLLKEAFPAIRQVGFVYGIDIREDRRREYEAAAAKIDIALTWRKHDKADLPSLAAKLNASSDHAFLIALDELLTYNRSDYIAQLANVKRPLMYPEEATEKGILMHYVPIFDGEAKAAEYISKLLRGAKVRDLAVQEPQEFDFSVNVTTLRRNGLTMSRDVLARARKVE